MGTHLLSRLCKPSSASRLKPFPITAPISVSSQSIAQTIRLLFTDPITTQRLDMLYLQSSIALLVALCHLATAYPKAGSAFPYPKAGSAFPCHSPGFPRCSWSSAYGYSLGEAEPNGDKYACREGRGWCCPTNKVKYIVSKDEFDHLTSQCFKMTE
ncbi:hypothetical protein Pst134EA_027732 [Puccinia striiformis f. sp. tritici]|uniref:Uncharacterized protein n=2 Tax=Puccinia striiformis TaxID=27350 RepID=A0A2S4VL43_9BASI|nr:hypothetical protein Pst134EA_027732 [Puccinia striiformis f. sp. tritici]KAH9448421.1 hypothetical protein Pst134EA_027732 [Puccinia striiformis f. sp. tritici]POW10168.1 hypothetical protein PSHT_08880 [Puccinia striiformis]